VRLARELVVRPRARIVVGDFGADLVHATGEAEIRAHGRRVAAHALLHAQLARRRIEERAAQHAARERDADVRDAGPTRTQIAHADRDGVERRLRIRELAQTREHRLGLIQRERDVVLDVDRLRRELPARHRIARIARRATAEQQHGDARRDDEQRQQHEHAGRRCERTPDALRCRCIREAALVHRASVLASRRRAAAGAGRARARPR
jgi:hypothetical protein